MGDVEKERLGNIRSSGVREVTDWVRVARQGFPGGQRGTRGRSQGRQTRTGIKWQNRVFKRSAGSQEAARSLTTVHRKP